MRRSVGAALAVAIFVALVVAWRSGYLDATRVETVRQAVRAAREVPFAPALYALLYVVAIPLLMPTTVLAVTGGALFGFLAIPLALAGALLGSAVTHALGRYTGRFSMRRFLENHPLLERLRDDASLWDLIRLRVLPVAPFGLLDYLAGMSGIQVRPLLLATAAGILPTMTGYVFVGRELARALHGEGSARTAIMIAVGITVTVVILSVAPTVGKMVSRRGGSG